jgi:hypothetical protein
MGEVDVDAMMARISARQFKEWEAYERATGPLDSGFERETMAQTHELIQINNILTGASLTKKGKKNPAGKFRNAYRPEHFTNPYLHISEDGSSAQDIEDEDEEFLDDIDDIESDEYEEEEDSYESDPNEYDPSKDPFAYLNS